jgi:hypothetical protein
MAAIGGHSLRAGFVTEAGRQNMRLPKTMKKRKPKFGSTPLCGGPERTWAVPTVVDEPRVKRRRVPVLPTRSLRAQGAGSTDRRQNS